MTIERAQRAITALRTPDASLARVPNTVRQSIAEVIEDLLAAHPAQGTAEWQPIKTAPKIEKGCYRAIPFLAWCPDDTAPDGGDQRIVWWEPRIKNGCWWGDRDLEETPTHWKPLGARP